MDLVQKKLLRNPFRRHHILIPFLGDFFDMTFKANTRNVEIYREALRGGGSRSKDSLFVTGVILAIVAILAIPVIAIVLLLNQLR